MSVICSAPTAASAASSGVQTRRTAPSSAGSNVLLVKGAAECLLGRSSHVSLPLASPALHAPASHSLRACQLSPLPQDALSDLIYRKGALHVFLGTS